MAQAFAYATPILLALIAAIGITGMYMSSGATDSLSILESEPALTGAAGVPVGPSIFKMPTIMNEGRMKGIANPPSAWPGSTAQQNANAFCQEKGFSSAKRWNGGTCITAKSVRVAVGWQGWGNWQGRECLSEIECNPKTASASSVRAPDVSSPTPSVSKPVRPQPARPPSVSASTPQFRQTTTFSNPRYIDSDGNSHYLAVIRKEFADSRYYTDPLNTANAFCRSKRLGSAQSWNPGFNGPACGSGAPAAYTKSSGASDLVRWVPQPNHYECMREVVCNNN